jgi:geranylgeranyl pyrophosphate synthase
MHTTPEIVGERSKRDAKAVDALMRRGGPRLLRRMSRAESQLERTTAEVGAPLASYVTAGGKRVRPLLVLLAAEAVPAAEGVPTSSDGGVCPGAGVRQGEREDALIRAAVAVELMHSATLAHDDILDGARVRRGHPTVVALAGRKGAIATGDLLFARAFAELARNRDVTQLRALSDAALALAVGELLQQEDLFAAHVSVDRYLQRSELKTAALFEVACRLGARVVAGIRPAGRGEALPAAGADGVGADGVGADDVGVDGAGGDGAGGDGAGGDGAGGDGPSAAVADGRAARLTRKGPPRSSVAGLGDVLGRFARRIGLAFQLIDDALDVSGPAAQTGKWRGTDLLDGTVTLPLILARQSDPELAALDLRALRGPRQAEVVCEKIAATGALAEAREWAFQIVRQAKAELPHTLPRRLTELLNLVADAVVERYR